MKVLSIAVLLFSISIFKLDAFAEQKMIFCGETYRQAENHDLAWMLRKETVCKDACMKDCELDKLLSVGWKIDTNMHKEIIKEEWMIAGRSYIRGCTCNGIQYVLSKAEKKVEVAPDTDKVSELLKKEMELLKKENDMLKKENEGLKKEGEVLKQENDALKTKSKKKK
jgi:FtsZ-binding cell division protein ZapB